MKILFFLFILFRIGALHAQIKIEDINSDTLVKKFVRQENQKKNFVWAYFQLTTGNEVSQFNNQANKNFTPIAAYIPGTKWSKQDINNDGKKDLIISGVTKKPEGKYFDENYRLLIFLSNGSSYQQIDLVTNYLEYYPVYFDIINVEEKTCLKLTRIDIDNYSYEPKIITDTLIYSFKTFVNYNRNPSKLKIDSVIYYTESNWFTYMPTYFVINKRGSIFYRKGDFSLAKSLEVHFVISKRKLRDMFSLTNYVDPLHLKENYSKPVFDVGNTHLIIKYKNGLAKSIDDYGHYGTYGLRAIYDRILDIINTIVSENNIK
jgi:hypothetical protein